jgi:hypothetical protein
MMPFIVIEVPVPSALRGQVRAFGPYGTEELAEAARRRRHFDNWTESKWSQPSTYVAEIGEAI